MSLEEKLEELERRKQQSELGGGQLDTFIPGLDSAAVGGDRE